MGMFDTFVINPPVECPECKAEIFSVQSKAFGQTLERYQPGTLVKQSKIRCGINEIRELHEYETSDNKEEYLKKPFHTTNVKQYLEQDDPLTALLAGNNFYIENTADEIFG